MRDRENDDLARANVKYYAPVRNAQAHRRIALQPLDLIPEGERLESKLVERLVDSLLDDRIQSVELPRRFGRQDNCPGSAHAGFFNCTTLCSVWSALSKKRRTPRAAWRMRCSFSTSASRT